MCQLASFSTVALAHHDGDGVDDPARAGGGTARVSEHRARLQARERHPSTVARAHEGPMRPYIIHAEHSSSQRRGSDARGARAHPRAHPRPRRDVRTGDRDDDITTHRSRGSDDRRYERPGTRLQGPASKRRCPARLRQDVRQGGSRTAVGIAQGTGAGHRVEAARGDRVRLGVPGRGRAVQVL